MKLKSKVSKETFENGVFGGWQIAVWFPELFDEGVDYALIDGLFYILNKDGKPVSNSCFFTQDEVNKYIVIN